MNLAVSLSRRGKIQYVVAAHLGHDQVEQHDVELMRAEHLERGTPTERLGDPIAVQPDDFGEALQQLRFVVDQQQAWLVGDPISTPRVPELRHRP